jgi:hypothetical protein
MIYCNLKGGLANMLFQIATTKSMAIDLVLVVVPNLIYHIIMDSDDYYNPRLKHSFEYQEMFSRLRYTQPTQQLPVIRYPLSIKFQKHQMMNFILMGFSM